MTKTIDELFREEMFPGNAATFADLKKYMSEGRITAFTGAGVSVPIFPTWTGLLSQYLEELGRFVPEDLRAVTVLLEDLERVEALREVRDYMSHRDVRRYYDIGRLAVAVVGTQWYRRVESAFAKMLFLALRSARGEREAVESSPIPDPPS